MRPKHRSKQRGHLRRAGGFVVCLLCAALTVPAVDEATTNSTPEPLPPVTPRQFFNAGTHELQSGKLREAEGFLESALAAQNSRLQPVALYNLGHTRFGQGIEELKKGPAAKPSLARGKSAEELGEGTIRSIDEALASQEIHKMVESYQRGRGTRRELKAAMEAIRRALEVHSTALAKWQRSSGDFKSALELNGTDPDAQHNAQVVDRCIAKLIDSVRELQQCKNGIGDKQNELSEKMKQLKGKIPGSEMPPGAAGEEEEDEETPRGPLPGQQEPPSRDGKEMFLSPEQAGWLLQGFKLDADRRLPMGLGGKTQPKDRTGPTW